MGDATKGEVINYGGGGAATLERTTPYQALDQLTQYVANARTILTEKSSQGAGFDISTTAAGQQILFNEALVDFLKQWVPIWSGDAPGYSATPGGKT
jgi:hypothetical protein